MPIELLPLIWKCLWFLACDNKYNDDDDDDDKMITWIYRFQTVVL